jgi:hypothetical protein
MDMIHKLSLLGDRIQQFIVIGRLVIKVDISFTVSFENDYLIARYVISMTNKSEGKKVLLKNFRFELVDR